MENHSKDNQLVLEKTQNQNQLFFLPTNSGQHFQNRVESEV